jgi:two-component system CheB/CheR fusion protein
MKQKTMNPSSHHKNIVPPGRDINFPIIGIGASAGGLDAFTQLLKGLPSRTGIAVVLIQHLDPTHDSMTAEILSRSTKMPVTEVTDGMQVEVNNVYVIPPNHAMAIEHGILKLLPRTELRGPYMTIDFFLQSLAEDQKNKAIGVVLSGTASDGTEGLRAIKAIGGLTFAQEPSTAKFDSMPRSAIGSGSVDFILPPDEIGTELVRVANHPYLKLTENQELVPILKKENDDPDFIQAQLARIFQILKHKTKIDFTEYKHSTIDRRIARRMVVQKKESLEDYLRYLETNTEEVDALYADILIHVTRFFRDPDAFKALKESALPGLMKTRLPDSPLRIWVAGCSTGEEVYSLAITLVEFLAENSVAHTPLQIFGTDISEIALQKARIGTYPETISRDVSVERLKRFFVKTEEGYKINKTVRDLCVFSRHDLTGDPPFARLDLISCRNLLIYFSAALQKRVLPIFQYAINPEGLLWLGRSESISGFSELFGIIDKTHKIYLRRPGKTDARFRYPSDPQPPIKKKTFPKLGARKQEVGFNLQNEADRLVLAESAAPGVLINERMEILQYRGRVVPYLEPASGQPSHHLLKMANPALVSDLRLLIHSSKKKKTITTKQGLDVVDETGGLWTFNLKVIPIDAPSPKKELFFLVLFENTSIKRKEKNKGSKKLKSGTKSVLETVNTELERELAELKKFLETLAQDYEVAHEELGATNEEFQSTNEELQSANEELETAKEELQSTNEELTTVNEELQNRNTELNQLNNDLINFLSSVEIPILMVGNDGRIRRFTPNAEKILNLISADVGRPIVDIKSHFRSVDTDLDLGQMIVEVIKTGGSKETEVQDRNNRWYRLQIKPYRTLENLIDGAVIAFIDIDILKQVLKDVKAARSDAENANRAKDLFLATLSHELRTPLTAILSWAQLLRRGKLTSEKSQRAAVMIEESGKVQAQLINDLLDVSRIVNGKVALELEELEPKYALQYSIDSTRSLAEAKAIHIENFSFTDVGTVMGDTARLQQIFSNLLTNAIKFSPRESTITVKMERIGKTIEIQVTDQGKGILPEFLPHIFDRFTQADSSATRVLGSLGLGLAIVRNLLELQGGKVVATSGGPGKGATFTVYLPLKSDKKSAETQRLEKSFNIYEEEMRKVRLDGLKVLLVDDDEKAREALTVMIQSYGAELQSADSVASALEIFAQFRPDVLLCDIAMPGEDGYSLIKKIRALPQSKGGKTPAIAVTAYAGTADIQRCLASGFQYHIAKPVDSDRMANKILSSTKLMS